MSDEEGRNGGGVVKHPVLNTPERQHRAWIDWLVAVTTLRCSSAPPSHPAAPRTPPGDHTVDSPGAHPPCPPIVPYTTCAAPTTQRPAGDHAQTRRV